jgi:DNA modification methylase
MHIFWAEIEDEKIKNLGILNLINDNQMSINKGYGLLKDKKKKEEKKEVRLELEFQRKCTKGHYELFNKSAFNLDFIEDASQDICVFSPPYAKAMKEYRNQDEMRHGQEKTIVEYISNEMIVCNEVMKKIGENGVMAVIIGESHKGGYSSVISRYELALIENGWEIIGVVQWIKENPTPVRLKEFFQPAEEKIIICKKKGAKSVFFNSPVKEVEGEGEFVLKQSHKSKDGDPRYYIGGDETITTNILITPVFDKKEFGDIDPSFKHDAPCPFAVYDKILSAYSRPNMRYLEIFSGSGQGLVSAIRHGLEPTGVEIDPKSVEFTKKRLDHLIDEKKSITITTAA